MRTCVFVLIFGLWAASPASAQVSPDSRFSVAATGGIGTGGHHAGGAIGGSFGIRLSSRVDTEIEGTYADRGPGVEALALEGRLQVALLPRSARVVPQVTFGAAAYRAHFAMGGRDMFGQFPQMPGGRFSAMPYGGMMQGPQPGAYRGSMWTGAQSGPVNMPQIPMFYAQRMGDVQVGADGRMASRTFTDPAAVFGGGVTFNATPHLFVRPEARALLIIGDGDTHTVGFFTVRMGFRF